VVNVSGYDVQFGTGNVGRGEFGVLIGRRLGIAGTDGQVGRDFHLTQPRLIHPEGLDNPWRHREDRLDPWIGDIECRSGIERQLIAQMLGHHPIVLPSTLKRQVFLGVDTRPTEP